MTRSGAGATTPAPLSYGTAPTAVRPWKPYERTASIQFLPVFSDEFRPYAFRRNSLVLRIVRFVCLICLVRIVRLLGALLLWLLALAAGRQQHRERLPAAGANDLAQ